MKKTDVLFDECNCCIMHKRIYSFHPPCWVKYLQVYPMYMMTVQRIFLHFSKCFPEMRNFLSPNDVRGSILLFLSSFDNGVAQHFLIVTVTSRAPAWKFPLQDGSNIESLGVAMIILTTLRERRQEECQLSDFSTSECLTDEKTESRAKGLSRRGSKVDYKECKWEENKT